MRTTLISLAVLLLALAGYAYIWNPAGCQKLLDDAGTIVISLSPVPLHPDAASPLSPLIQGKPISADGTPFGFPANAPATSIRYYAIYYSAQWCPPCHAFTPVLVEWYKKFKPSHPNFEIMFVSEDRNEAAMLDYMKEMAMPWPALRFSDLKHDGNGTFKGSGIEKFAGSGIPDLVLVDAGGKVLSDSFQDGSYVGPQAVVADINRLIGGSAPISLVP